MYLDDKRDESNGRKEVISLVRKEVISLVSTNDGRGKQQSETERGTCTHN